MKYFVFNKTSDYTRGFTEHLAVGPEGLKTKPGCFGRAACFSRVLDSRQEGVLWHRMTGRSSQGAAVQISFYTSDTLKLPDGTGDVQSLIRAEGVSVQEKKERLKPFLQKNLPFGPDLLLHSLKGRYLWFLLEIYPQTEEPVSLGDFRVSFPAKSWVSYLPEIYQKEMGNDSFLDRYLSIFQSLYDDMGEQIRGLADCLDPAAAKGRYLEWIAKWLDVEDPYMWKEEQLRYLLEHIMEFQAARGTRKGIELFVELYTGEKPFVVERQDWEGFEGTGKGRLCLELYREDPGSFTVLVREECVPAYQEQQTLLRMLERLKPVQMDVHLVLLKPYIFADGYSYLGVNSVLGQYEEAVLGGSRAEFATVAGDWDRSES